MSPSISSDSTQVITNVVFGITATTISVVTVWQGHRVWKMWREHARDQGSGASDIELGLQSFPATPTSVGAPEREEVIATAAPPADHTGDVAGPDHIAVSTPGPERHSIPPTALDVETSFSPAVAQGARTEHNENPRGHAENAQPALTKMERRELQPAANDDL